MDLITIQDVLKTEKPYRLKQAKKALFCDLIENWDQATNLPEDLRAKLKTHAPLEISAEVFVSKDKSSQKALFALKDGLKIESVLMRHNNDRNTVCVSSQVGCPLACKFCATGQMGFKRNLEYSEIVSQVLFFARILKKEGAKITNIVFMGMGEPFLNYENVLESIKILNDKDGFNLGIRHFSISTVGITEGIKRIANEELQINIAISLHAPNDELRSQIMPINEKYPISQIIKAVDGYIKKTGRKVMFEYIMIKGVNDSQEQAKELAKLMKKKLYFVNLISYNPTGIFEPSAPETIAKFKEILEKDGIFSTLRYKFGDEIQGACGQLAGKK